ncbi:MAG: heat-inducible transcription repressor HrcA [Clostridia bacterium]|nr:heat-inducible transcription repressor HrcA [Clostridia bacterium]
MLTRETKNYREVSPVELGDRKKKILQLIIESYIETAEPVGSRYIAKKNDLSLSPATIRNEMADLEEMGYLEQPHTSAGRVPSQAGYRFYVDQLMERYFMTMADMERVNQALKLQTEEIDKIIARVCQVMSDVTDFTTVAVTPKHDKSRIKKLDLVMIDAHSFLAVIVTDNAIVKNKLFRTSGTIDEKALKLFSGLLNQTLTNISIGSITLDMINSLKKAVPEYANELIPVLNFVHEVVTQLDRSNLYMKGANNILKYPEFADLDKARSFIEFLEDGEAVSEIIKKVPDGAEQTSIIIGSENNNPHMAGSSLILRTYKIDDTAYGCLGLIGPIRMDYRKAVSDIEYFGRRLSLLFEEIFHGGET